MNLDDEPEQRDTRLLRAEPQICFSLLPVPKQSASVETTHTPLDTTHASLREDESMTKHAFKAGKVGLSMMGQMGNNFLASTGTSSLFQSATSYLRETDPNHMEHE